MPYAGRGGAGNIEAAAQASEAKSTARFIFAKSSDTADSSSQELEVDVELGVQDSRTPVYASVQQEYAHTGRGYVDHLILSEYFYNCSRFRSASASSANTTKPTAVQGTTTAHQPSPSQAPSPPPPSPQAFQTSLHLPYPSDGKGVSLAP